MSIVKCPECGKEVSDATKICPNCGYNIKKHYKSQRKEDAKLHKHQKKLAKNVDKERKSEQKSKNYRFMGIVLVFIIVLLLAVYAKDHRMKIEPKFFSEPIHEFDDGENELYITEDSGDITENSPDKKENGSQFADTTEATPAIEKNENGNEHTTPTQEDKTNHPPVPEIEEPKQDFPNDGPPAIGMTAEQMENSSWGKPVQKRVVTDEDGTFELWVYTGKRSVALENGIVTEIIEVTDENPSLYY